MTSENYDRKERHLILEAAIPDRIAESGMTTEEFGILYGWFKERGQRLNVPSYSRKTFFNMARRAIDHKFDRIYDIKAPINPKAIRLIYINLKFQCTFSSKF